MFGRARVRCLWAIGVSLLGTALYSDDALGRRVALLVGVNQYLKPGFTALDFAEADVRAVGKELERLGFEVTMLLGSHAGAEQASRENILQAAQRIVTPLGQNDIALVMLSGHGQQLAGDAETAAIEATESYYCPVDAVINRPETQVSLSYLLDQILAPNVGRKLLLVDACRDVPIDRSRGGKQARGIEGRVIKLPEDTGVFFSCRAGQMSFERHELGHGLFTYCVLDALRGGAVIDGEISWPGLIQHVGRRMTQPDLKQYVPQGGAQVPISGGAMPYIVLARVHQEGLGNNALRALPLSPTPSAVASPTIPVMSTPPAVTAVMPQSRPATAPPAANPTPLPTGRDALIGFAETAYSAYNYAECIRASTALIERYPQEPIGHVLRAYARIELGYDPPDSSVVRAGLSDARAALKLQLNFDAYTGYLYGMAYLSTIEGRRDHAEDGLKAAEMVFAKPGATTAQRANLLAARAALYEALADFDRARQDVAAALRLVPGHPAALLRDSRLAARAGDTAAIERSLDAAVSAAPDQPMTFLNRAVFRHQAGRTADALRDLDQVLQLDSRNLMGLQWRGDLRIQAGQYSGAKDDLTKYIASDARKADVFRIRAVAALHLGELDGAIGDLETAIRLEPHIAAAQAELGIARFCGRDYPRAVAEFDRALLLDPGLTYLAPWRYTALVFANQRERALAEYSAVRSRAKDSRTWFDELVLHVLGDSTAAELLAAIDRSNAETAAQQECEANYFIGLRLASRERPDEAQLHFEQALSSGQSQLAAFRAARYALSRFANE